MKGEETLYPGMQSYVRVFKEGTKVSTFLAVCTVHPDGIHESRFDVENQKGAYVLYKAIKAGEYGTQTDCWMELVTVTEEHRPIETVSKRRLQMYNGYLIMSLPKGNSPHLPTKGRTP